ncbi:hypothetical protein D3C71_1036450 [compost metagenome]
MAGQTHVDVEVEVAIQGLDLVDHVRLHLGRMAASPQQGQHQRSELVAQRQAGKTKALHLRVGAHTLQAERGLANIVTVGAQGDLVAAQGLDGCQQVQHLAGSFAVVQGSHQLKRLLHALQVGGELGLELFVEHGGVL